MHCTVAYNHISMLNIQLLAIVFAFIGPNRLEVALEKAGDNRSELEAVLEHYPEGSQKKEAARFLIENMAGHNYAELIFFDPEDERVAFDALSYDNYEAASAAMTEIEKNAVKCTMAKAKLLKGKNSPGVSFLTFIVHFPKTHRG